MCRCACVCHGVSERACITVCVCQYMCVCECVVRVLRFHDGVGTAKQLRPP